MVILALFPLLLELNSKIITISQDYSKTLNLANLESITKVIILSLNLLWE